jgi:vitamin B12 transporter
MVSPSPGRIRIFLKNTVYRGNYGYAITPSIYFDVQTSYTDSNTDDPGQIPYLDPDAFLVRETWNISPRIAVKLTDFYTSTFYYNRTQLREVDSDLYDDSHNRSQINTDSIDWQNDFQIARNWKITAGIQGDHYGASDFDDVNDYEDIHANLSNLGGYAQSQWQPVQGLNLLNSVRYDDYSQFKGAFSWRQGISYQTPVTATVLHASVASSYETPTVEDLYSPGFFGEGVGNPHLQPETSLGWEIGADQPFWNRRIDVSATYFHNDLKNLIDDVGPLYTPTNIGRATTQGAEIGVTVQPFEQWSVNLNYTYLSALDDTDQTRLLRRPRDTLNFTTSYQPIKPVTISLGGSWIVDRDDVEVNAPYDDIKAPDYFVLRGNITYEINDHVSIWLRGENLTGISYQPALGYPALGMGGYGGIKVSF